MEASRRRARPPHHRGMISAIATGAATTDQLIASKLDSVKGAFSNIKDSRGAV